MAETRISTGSFPREGGSERRGDGYSDEEILLYRQHREFSHYEELLQLRCVVSNTRSFRALPRSVPAWNESIHQPMLKLALTDHDRGRDSRLDEQHVAKPSSPPADYAITTLSLGSKMIDYALVLRLHADLDLARCIAAFIDAQPAQAQFFNQTWYTPLQAAPSSVFVETKTDGSGHAEAQAQLGVWSASWFHRVRSFTMADATPNESDGWYRVPPPPVLPLLLVIGDAWELWFPMDSETDVRIVGPLDIGSTASLDRSYRLLAALRRLVAWMEGPFQSWVREVVGNHRSRGYRSANGEQLLRYGRWA